MAIFAPRAMTWGAPLPAPAADVVGLAPLPDDVPVPAELPPGLVVSESEALRVTVPVKVNEPLVATMVLRLVGTGIVMTLPLIVVTVELPPLPPVAVELAPPLAVAEPDPEVDPPLPVVLLELPLPYKRMAFL